MKRTFLLKLSLPLAAGAAVGFAVGNFSASSLKLHGRASPSEKVMTSFARTIEEALKEANPRTRSRALRRLIDDIENIPAALKCLKEHQGQGDSRIIFNLELELLEAWAHIDPKAAIAYADQYSQPRRAEAIESVISAWLKHNRTGAQAYVEDLPKGDLRSVAEYSLLSFLAIHDPAAALKTLNEATHRSIPLGGIPSSSIINPRFYPRGGSHTLFARIAQRDPLKAVELALALPEGNQRTDAISALVDVWGASDPKAAISFVRELPPSASRKQALDSLITTLGTQEPQEAIKLAMAELPGQGEQRHAILNAVKSWAKTDLGAARAWVEQLPSGELRHQATTSFIQQWAFADPKAAMHYLQKEPKSSALDLQLGITLAQWVIADPKGGLQWLNENPGTATPRVLADAAMNLSYQKPAQAIELIGRMAQGPEQNMSYHNIAHRWIKIEPTAANAWFEKMPPGASRDHFLQGIIAEMATYDIVGAARKTDALPPGSSRDQTTLQLASTWAQADPGAALDWVARSTEGKAQENAIGRIMSEWARSDIDAASDWLNTLSAGNLRDTAIMRFTETVAFSDAESAAAWAASIGNEK